MTTRSTTTTQEHWGPSDPLSAPPTVAAARAASVAVRRAALVAGAALTLMAGLAGFGNLVVVEGLVTPGDAAATAQDILASMGLFRLGVVTLYLAALLDVVVAWALFRVFSPVNSELSRLDAWLRLAYSAVFMVALAQLSGIPALLTDPGEASVFTAEQYQAMALSKVDAFHDIWFAGLILFGVHLVIAGYLAYRSRFIPRPIGVLLVIAGAGYAADSLVDLSTAGAPFAVSNLTFLGEFLLGLWLLIGNRRIWLSETSTA